MRVIPARGASSQRGPAEWFTGSVWRDALPPPEGSPDVAVSRVLFDPGARTHWHTHPEGQILHVVSGTGRAQTEGAESVGIGPGDVVYFVTGERHRHVAAPDNAMVHPAINPAASSDGGTDWQGPVTDEEYAAGE